MQITPEDVRKSVTRFAAGAIKMKAPDTKGALDEMMASWINKLIKQAQEAREADSSYIHDKLINMLIDTSYESLITNAEKIANRLGFDVHKIKRKTNN